MASPPGATAVDVDFAACVDRFLRDVGILGGPSVQDDWFGQRRCNEDTDLVAQQARLQGLWRDGCACVGLPVVRLTLPAASIDDLQAQVSAPGDVDPLFACVHVSGHATVQNQLRECLPTCGDWSAPRTGSPPVDAPGPPPLPGLGSGSPGRSPET